MSETNAVTATVETPSAPKKKEPTGMRGILMKAAPMLQALNVDPSRYIEQAMMATAKEPKLLQCTTESFVLAVRQAAVTGLDIGTTCHLVAFNSKIKKADGTEEWGSVCTFIPDYKGLIELAVATHKVVSIRTRCVYAGEPFEYFESGAGPDIRHTPRASGIGGQIVGAYAIADLRFGRFKVEYVTFDEIEAVRAKSKSWAKGELPDWYGRKTAVRKLCKTLPSSKKLQEAIRYDDAEDLPDIPDADVSANDQRALPRGFNPVAEYGDTSNPPRYHGADLTPIVVDESAEAKARALSVARGVAATSDPYDSEEAA